MKNLEKNMNVKLAAPSFVYGGHCSDTFQLIVDRIDNLCYHFPGYKKPVICAHKLVHNITAFLSNPPHILNESPPASLSSGSVVLLITVLQIFVLLLTVALCCCLMVCAARGRTYTVNGHRSARRRAAAATLSAFQARTSRLVLALLVRWRFQTAPRSPLLIVSRAEWSQLVNE
ncbi:hypothetical protein niasHT_010258 [Heterodera trifolii]|uniref:Uncharacterized protein n=1 Tax=Heterodera trifolii TaxID=157864 RepID=A0ABD2LST2_9BILA